MDFCCNALCGCNLRAIWIRKGVLLRCRRYVTKRVKTGREAKNRNNR